MLIAGFDLKGDLAVFHGNHARGAMDGIANGRGREMADINFNTHGTFIRIEVRIQRQAGGAFEKADQVGSGHHGGHAVAGKFHGVFGLRGNGQFKGLADFGT